MAVEGFGWLAGSVGENSGSNSAKKDWGRGSIRARWRCPVESGAVQNRKEIFAEGEELKG